MKQKKKKEESNNSTANHTCKNKTLFWGIQDILPNLSLLHTFPNFSQTEHSQPFFLSWNYLEKGNGF